MRTVVCYVDGFNLYHAIDDLKKPHLKWADLWSLANSFVRPNEVLVGVNYFSAYATWRPDQFKRHRDYVKALERVGVTPILGHFKQKYRKCFSCKATWTDHEEKETDVRLALKLLEDAFCNRYDRAILVSGDSDLVPAIQTVKSIFPGKTFLLAAPPGRFASARDLCAAADSKIEIRPNRIASNLLPEIIEDGDGNLLVSRPVEYAPPV